ncbi:hypothetical protein FH972_026192 [Carpinus fangiana]|uniref:Ribosome-assembly protein 3 C-terminal domain-containing protein n=1 Tax=Carpinus fangiana TaxID=176857 RepID=A0A5N6L5V3_9ROSI|nr:hypothetical protein FH972_026192 [Carpinus fangiana]
MVRLEEVEDEAFGQTQQGPEEEGDWDTDSESDVSSVYSDEAEDETLFERISALKDVVPPAQRRQLQSVAGTTSEWGWWGISNIARLSWVVGVSAILLAIPFAVGSSEDAQIAMEEKQMQMQQSQTDISCGAYWDITKLTESWSHPIPYATMPLVKIDMIKGVRSPEDIKKLADIVQEVMLDKFNAPSRDRYQIITQHEPYEMICEDTNLGFERTDKLVFIQIFQQGRDVQKKQAVYAALAECLGSECGVPGTDLITKQKKHLQTSPETLSTIMPSTKVASKPVRKTRSRKRKARTEVSSSSSSSSSESSQSSDSSEAELSEHEEPTARSMKKQKKAEDTSILRQTPEPVQTDVRDVGESAQTISTSKKKKDKQSKRPKPPSSLAAVTSAAPATENETHRETGEEKEARDLENWYLRAVTQQYADDLSALRNAPDFRDASVPILIKALMQGATGLLKD